MKSKEYGREMAITSRYAKFPLGKRLALRPHTARLISWCPDVFELEGMIETDDSNIRCIVSAEIYERDIDAHVLISAEPEDYFSFCLELFKGGGDFTGTEGAAADLLREVAKSAAEAIEILEEIAHALAREDREPSRRELAQADNSGVADLLKWRAEYLRMAKAC